MTAYHASSRTSSIARGHSQENIKTKIMGCDSWGFREHIFFFNEFKIVHLKIIAIIAILAKKI